MGEGLRGGQGEREGGRGTVADTSEERRKATGFIIWCEFFVRCGFFHGALTSIPRARTVSHLSASSSLLGPPSPLPRTSADPFSLSDGRPFDPTDASEDYTAEERAATARWVAERLEEREDEFLDKDEVRVWCGTFNVNDRQPKGGAQDVQPWVDSCDGAELLVFACVSAPLAARAPCRY